MLRLALAFCALVWAFSLFAEEGRQHTPLGPFPLEGKIYNGQGQLVASAKVYPRYVEIFEEGQLLGKVGIMVDKGWAHIHLINQDDSLAMVGYAHKGRIFNSKDQPLGTYFWTPTYSYVYDLDGKRVGHTKCIAWPRVCSVAVAGYLLKLIQGPPPEAIQTP
ncbi:MAG: hypothetical protein RRB13_09340 [bacterium]|nr:hypothetical protein [bacterium]